MKIKKQKVVRTTPTDHKLYYTNHKDNIALHKLLEEGWTVVMCNRIGQDLEYIVEKEVDENEYTKEASNQVDSTELQQDNGYYR